MFCPKCAREAADEDAFCRSCGTSFTGSGGLGGNAPLGSTVMVAGERAAPRSAGLLILFGLITCGIYVVYWYFSVLGELERAGDSPTGHSPWLDLLLAIVTCSIWGLYVDYRISKSIYTLQDMHGVSRPSDTSIGVIILDVVGLGIVGSAIHQSEMNRLWTTGRW